VLGMLLAMLHVSQHDVVEQEEHLLGNCHTCRLALLDGVETPTIVVSAPLLILLGVLFSVSLLFLPKGRIKSWNARAPPAYSPTHSSF